MARLRCFYDWWMALYWAKRKRYAAARCALWLGWMQLRYGRIATPLEYQRWTGLPEPVEEPD